MPNIKLQSSDGDVFHVDERVAKMSELIKTMFDNLGDDNDDVIPLFNVSSRVYNKVCEWSCFHMNDPDPGKEDSTRRAARIDFDEKFVKVDHNLLIDLITAANYLDIKGLLELTAKTAANLLIGKTPEEMRQMFNIVNDFGPGEEEEARQAFEWLSDENTHLHEPSVSEDEDE